MEQPAVIVSPPTIRGSVSNKRLVAIMVGVLLGMLLSALDQTVVGTALPQIVADLGGLDHYSWVVTSYLLTSTVGVPIYGKLSDIYGRRIFFVGGMVVFLLGSALSGQSHTMTQLILFRGVQGLGAGAMMPIAIALIGDIFPPAERGKWQGLLMAVFGLATIVGPSLGGWLTDNWGWPWVFYVNMPVGVLAIGTTVLALPTLTSGQEHAIDYVGAALLILGGVPLLLGISWGGTEYPWGSAQIIGLLVLAVVVLVGFLLWENRFPEPILAPSLFKNSIFTVSVIATFIVAAGMFGAILYLPLFIQAVVGESATNSGAILTPMMLGFMVSSVIGGWLLSRTGRYKVLAVVGFAIAAVGMFLLARMDADVTSRVVVRDMIITGLGIGVSMSLFTIVVQNAFPFRMLGQVTAAIQFFRSIGSTIGVAVLGTIMTTQFHSAFYANLPATVKQSVPPEQLAQLDNPQLLLSADAVAKVKQGFEALGPQGLQLFDQITATIRLSLSSAITDLFMVSTGAMIAALVASFFLKEIPLRKGHHEEGVLVDAAEPFTEGVGEWAQGNEQEVHIPGVGTPQRASD
ncbi:MAG TPA: MDR family MFS transporter [Candidatus Limnocylindria bacterium]|nr:MDR family MFS transporter [Candidatus Limnocylindria bacterium]